jgi:selenocysteine-specific elongation factor
MTDAITRDGPLVRLASHTISLDPAEQAAKESLLRTIDEAGFAPPLTEELGADAALLRALATKGDLVPIQGFYLTKNRADEAKQRVTAAIKKNGPITVAQIRDLLETTRKYAVPLCEWLDATGTTIRKGDVRLLGPRAQADLT